jgi:hypothetical protein
MRASRRTTDPIVRMELLTAASWLHQKAARIEDSGRSGVKPARPALAAGE